MFLKNYQKVDQESKARLEALIEEKKKKDHDEMQAKTAQLNEDKQQEWIDGLGFPYKLHDATFANFKKQSQEKAYNLALEFARNQLADEVKSPYALVLSSKSYGVGKTHLLHAIAVEIIRNTRAVWFIDTDTRFFRKPNGELEEIVKPCEPRYGHGRISITYINEPDLMCKIRSTYNPNSQERELDVFAKLNEPDLLIIDDVGKVKPSDLSFVQQVYYRLVEYRWGEEKFIAISTNLVGDELEKFIGGAVASRLAEMTMGKYFITMDGEDYRLKGIKNAK